MAPSVTKQIQDDVKAKIASKFMKVSGSVGKVDFVACDIDYTAGGMLSPRWARETDMTSAAEGRGVLLPRTPLPTQEHHARLSGPDGLPVRHEEGQGGWCARKSASLIGTSR